MPDPVNVAKAKLLELDADFKNVINESTTSTAVQFNPDSLKVSFANQIEKLGLVIETVIPVHGKIGTIADLKTAVGAKISKN